MAERNLVIRFSAKTAGLVTGVRVARRAVRQLGSAVARVRVGTLALGTGIAGALGAGGLGVVAKQALDSVDSLEKTAAAMGTTGSRIRELQLAAELGGTSFQQLQTSFTSFVNFARRTGQRATVGTFLESLKEVSKIKDASVRATTATERFGESWSKLGSLISAPTQNIKAAADAMLFFAAGTGLVGEGGLGKGAQQVEKLNDAWAILSARIAAVRDAIAIQLAPTVTPILEDLSQILRDWVVQFKGVDGAAASLVTRFVEIGASVRTALQPVIDTVQFLWNILQAVVGSIKVIGLAAGTFAGGISTLFSGTADSATGAEDAASQEIERQMLQVLQDIREGFASFEPSTT